MQNVSPLSDLTPMLQAVRGIAHDAAAVALQFYGRGDLAIDAKGDASPVTAADRATSEFICGRLAALEPGTAIVSEESAAAHEAVPSGDFWVVDPLDGTKEFIKRTGEFTINIALVQSGRPVLGVVHVPVSGQSFFAAQGGSAYTVAAAGEPQRIRTRRAQADALEVVASRDHAGPAVAELLRRLPSARTLSMGSSLKFCLVAAGRADIYLRDVPTMEWDTAAAQCVVEAAGGRISTLDGTPLQYGKTEFRNPALLTVGDADFPWSQYLP